MLGDVKSFFTKSTVGEVAVGLSVGAAFTEVMSSMTAMGRGLLHGQFEYGDVVQAVVALLAAVLFSLILVVKPLAKLKAMADRSQVALVADAAAPETVVTEPLAEEGSTDGLVAGTTADPTSDLDASPVVLSADQVADAAASTSLLPEEEMSEVAASAPVPDEVAVDGRPGEPAPGLAGEDDLLGSVPAPGEVLAGDPGGGLPVVADEGDAASAEPGSSRRYVWAHGDGDGSRLVDAAPSGGGAAPTGAMADGAAATRVGGAATADAAGSEQADRTSAAVAAATPTTEVPSRAAAATAPAAAPTPVRSHSHTVTKVCPYCAFDIPAVASRCGWCTADLTDAQRTAGVVLLPQ